MGVIFYDFFLRGICRLLVVVGVFFFLNCLKDNVSIQCSYAFLETSSNKENAKKFFFNFSKPTFSRHTNSNPSSHSCSFNHNTHTHGRAPRINHVSIHPRSHSFFRSTHKPPNTARALSTRLAADNSEIRN